MTATMNFPSRLPGLLGIRHPIVQGGMSWASSSAPLALAVSRAGALGVIAAGPMRPDDLVEAIRAVKAGTDAPFALNVPLYNKRSAEFLDIAEAERVPVIIASQGGPKALPRFRAYGAKWLHVVASPLHAQKADAAGVDGLIVVGGDAGGHPAPDEVSAMVLVRAVVKAGVKAPVIGAGGVADGAGIAAMFALGAEGAQLGTRFLMTEEASVHPAYKEAVRRAGLSDTTLVGRGGLPVRQLRNLFTAEVDAAERAGHAKELLAELYMSRTLKHAALEGDVERGKVEAGQTAGLIDDIPPAAEVVAKLVAEAEAARLRLAGGAA
ncbi:NAD(P)H-dependent flavin oxidoreductase [Roseomonas populi]|uniref:Nitronate monooxygenase family protein n=1 Tax=Roseomonas populi TaxID=3121582 RepID=A0ABT1X2H8_9PROT|nr:nitronate monooxygenase family protein [Roseomonas pecuniae]MCR0981169.1 nitronate monooxygenase family protein [Roseomonas pecuniae]